MRKNIFGRQLKRDANERKALFKGLMSSLVIHGRIKTTESKAKAIKGQIEKLVTKAKKGNSVANVFQEFLTPQSVTKLINTVAPVFAKRPGGYTRIIRLGNRFSDNASVVLLEWVEKVESSKLKVQSEKGEKKIQKVEKTSKKVEKVVDAPKAKRGRKPKTKETVK